MWGGGFELKGQRGNREARRSETRLSPQEKPVMLGFVPVGGGRGGVEALDLEQGHPRSVKSKH